MLGQLGHSGKMLIKSIFSMVYVSRRLSQNCPTLGQLKTKQNYTRGAKTMKKLIPIIVLFFAVSVFAQEKPKATLIDEFGSTQCDEMLARKDNLSIQLNNSPGAHGVVTVSGSNAVLIKKLELEILFTSGSLQRRADASRIQFIRGSENGEPQMRFWSVPADAPAPDIPAKTWDLRLSPETKPFYFFADGDDICRYSTVDKYIKELLQANPGLRVNVVIPSGNWKRFRQVRRFTLDAYGHEYSKRLRFFRVRNPFSVSRREFWLLP